MFLIHGMSILDMYLGLVSMYPCNGGASPSATDAALDSFMLSFPTTREEGLKDW